MMNISTDSSVFPSEWKPALVAPLHKDGPRDDVNHYRPIAVLPVLSKILERHVSKSLTNYLNENNLIFKYQSALGENHSTETALIKLTDKLLFNMDNDKVTGMISIDFKKAFDLVNHETLLQKLQMYGLIDSAVKWFRSYLSDRQQCVKVNRCTSSLLPVNKGDMTTASNALRHFAEEQMSFLKRIRRNSLDMTGKRYGRENCINGSANSNTTAMVVGGLSILFHEEEDTGRMSRNTTFLILHMA
ncbi:RNA-directed DNA polymerase from mobile element jockey [Stylophora pistillata]|uniref:RNA-directed DNA polymerase from mobile element jockey n=1 Tax=Stylophora pistillata TaxID=50429 RepID=A0A2B4RFB6_STYPI|nr:RNA-directed DNA polymerase from mobile element jockey [Stylophora pistillata]